MHALSQAMTLDLIMIMMTTVANSFSCLRDQQKSHFALVALEDLLIAQFQCHV